jgi:hypothetical protein
LKKGLLELGGLSNERRDSFAKKYDQLRFLVIDEISAMVDLRMMTIMQSHNDFMDGLDVIATGNLYQAPPICDAWIYKSQIGSLNELALNFWKEGA